MRVKKESGEEVWIWWPHQCKLCKGYRFKSNNETCKNERTQQFIDDIRELESKADWIITNI